MEELTRALADFVREHQVWAAPIVLALAFGESLAFISLLLPATVALTCGVTSVIASDMPTAMVPALTPAALVEPSGWALADTVMAPAVTVEASI